MVARKSNACSRKSLEIPGAEGKLWGAVRRGRQREGRGDYVVEGLSHVAKKLISF